MPQLGVRRPKRYLHNLQAMFAGILNGKGLHSWIVPAGVQEQIRSPWFVVDGDLVVLFG